MRTTSTSNQFNRFKSYVVPFFSDFKFLTTFKLNYHIAHIFLLFLLPSPELSFSQSLFFSGVSRGWLLLPYLSLTLWKQKFTTPILAIFLSIWTNLCTYICFYLFSQEVLVDHFWITLMQGIFYWVCMYL